MTRTEIDTGRARYRVHRPAWRAIGTAVGLRLALAVWGGLVGAFATQLGWI